MRQFAHRLMPSLLGLLLSAPHIANAGATPASSTLQPLDEAELRMMVGAGSDLTGALARSDAGQSSNADENVLRTLEDALKFHDRRASSDQNQRAMQMAATVLAPVSAVSLVNVATAPLALAAIPLLGGLLSLAQFASQAPRAPDPVPVIHSP